ncbi:amyloid-beta A4 precursor protein-binding family A member 2 isoform X1 [Fundulus heteroclitus]|uniref:amyloid-beta A4 precursor protein-binding family A member 2 isoform X1 n=1 Tax=Fundulus heteroclitus TaxID=8078 RepID=UPI00165B8F8A|nr:amyloid-beta A4 precursor protein-binding family A member 2 isoform X1 [Fundulus heteroclitus]XP_036004383.1 amyloid-beta A4 precursor protein-binding family A member 2 isoform X1 [Fundulus heteroclitus]
MAHGKKPGSMSKALAAGPPLCPGAGPTKPSQEEQSGSEETQRPPCSLRNDSDDQPTPPAPSNHFYMSCDPSPEDMEDACSEYDNVGSDVEQDYNEVLHVNRQGPVNVRYYNQHASGGVQRAEERNEDPAADQITQKPLHSTKKCERPRSEGKPYRMGHRFKSHCAPIAGDEAEGGMRIIQGDRFFFNDGEDFEEMLDGARFIEDLDEAEINAQRPSSLYQGIESERIKKGAHERKREDEARIPRNPSVSGAGKKPEPPHTGPKGKERQGKGRGRGAAEDETRHVVPGIKGGGSSSSSSEQHSKTMSKKSAVRSKDRPGSSKHHHPPPARHAQSPLDPQRTLPHRESPPAFEPHPSAADKQESESRPSKAALAPLHTAEQQRESPEERQRGSEKPEQDQGEKPSTAMTPEEAAEQPIGPQCPEPVSGEENNSPKKSQEGAAFPSFEDVLVPGPCEPEDLIDGIIFAANYLGCTQVLSDKNPSKSVRMSQAHKAVSQIKSQDEDSQMMTEVDLFISTKAVKVLNADTQETLMDSALRTISYIADIGSIVVLMARRRMSQASSEDFSESSDSASEGKTQYRMICYVFESEDAQLIAQSIGQAFSVAYREFLRANGINPTDLSHKQYSDIINSQEMYHDDLVHFSNSENRKELYVEKQKGESLGVVIVESGWGSILPTVILASMLNTGPAARSGKLSVGDQIMSINDTSLVGLPLATCQSIIKGLKNQVKVKLSIVSCPPVTTVLIKRPDLKYQLGFSVQNGIICSLMRGGIAERGGVRVGHRIIEIKGQSVVAMAHEKIVQTLSVSVGEINMKTMPAVMFRLLTGQETPIYI